METKKLSLSEKLSAIQGNLKAPKNQVNSFGKYKYRSAEDILEAVKPHLTSFNLSLTISDDLVQVGDRFYIKAVVKLFDSENSIETSAFAREEENKKGMDSAQVTGATSSYARKYALNGLLLIDDTKDADATNTHGKELEKPKANKTAVTDIKKLKELLISNKDATLKQLRDNKFLTKEQVTELNLSLEDLNGVQIN